MNSANRRTVYLDNIRNNISLIRKHVPASAGLFALVKADAYGHGAAETARAALSAGADRLAVARVKEGTALRQAGIRAPILVLGAAMREDAEEGVAMGLMQTVCAPEMVQFCEEAAERQGRTAEVQLKIDTGMGRIGVRTPEERDAVLEALHGSKHLRLVGAFTHFADADGDADGEAYTRQQFRRFLEMTDCLPKGICRHCANSAAGARFPEMALDAVRAGISLYGYPPVDGIPGLKPCMSWSAEISMIKTLPAGETVSYGRTWRAETPRRIATITCGYGDGYHRAASGKASVLIRGRRFPVTGRICMDQMMADITGAEDLRVGDEVILMGQSGNETITAEDIARWSGTISYEVLLSVGSRVERTFIGQESEEQA